MTVGAFSDGIVHYPPKRGAPQWQRREKVLPDAPF